MVMTNTTQLQAPTVADLREVARKFEAVFLPGCRRSSTPGPGSGERAPLHDIFNEEMAKLISRGVGVGVADAVLKETPKSQEVARWSHSSRSPC